MKALCIKGAGGPEVLQDRDVPEPDMGPFDVKVAVRATGLNRADILQCQGHYPAPPTAPRDIPGLEYAGVVLAAGKSAQHLRPGDRVMGIVGGGALAEQLVVHEREALPIPDGMDFAEAACIPEAFLTAFDALAAAELHPGESVLIHAVGSGVGTAALQLVLFFGAKPLGTSRSPEKVQRCAQLGLVHGLSPEGSPPRFADEVLALTSGRGADVVLDLVGGSYFPENLRAAATQGRIFCIGLLAGSEASIHLRSLLSKRLRVVGTVLRSRPLEEKIALAQRFAKTVLPAFSQKRLSPVLDRAFPISEVRAAYTHLAHNETFGKVVVTWP